jgi:hypothetical protein
VNVAHDAAPNGPRSTRRRQWHETLGFHRRADWLRHACRAPVAGLSPG